MAAMRGQALAHLDKSFENDKLSGSSSKGAKPNKQKSSSSPSSPSTSTTATPANSAASASTHDRDIKEKFSPFSVKRMSSSGTAVSSSSLHSNSSLPSSPILKQNNKEYKDISRMISTSLMTTGALLGSTTNTTATATSTAGRGRSNSSASVNSSKSKNSFDSATPSNHSLQQQQHHHHHHHIRLPSLPLHTPSFLKRRKQQGTTASLDSLSTSLPPHLRTHSSSSSLSSPVHKPDPHPHHAILMVPQHDIHIAFPHPVPSHNVFIAGTWTVPGHHPWEKLAMTHVPETNTFEITLNVQELEDISDYLDEDGYIHHELLGHPAEEHHEEETHSSTTTATTATGTTRISKRQRIRRFFGRARSSSSSSTTTTLSQPNHNTQGSSTEQINHLNKHEDTAYHHQGKDGGLPLPLSKEYRYQYKFVVDDEWMCDPQRPQVEDGHGHWNHELVVVLMEQNPALDTTHELLNRSRSSSLAESSVYAKSLPIPMVEVSEHKEEEGEGEKKSAEVVGVVEEMDMEKPDQGLDEEVSTTAVAAAATRRSGKAKETFEAVLVFEEQDDLSDGEGRSKNQVYSEDEEEDDQDEILSEAPAVDHDQNHSMGHTAEVKKLEQAEEGATTENKETAEFESRSIPVSEPTVAALASTAFVLLAAADPEEHTRTVRATSVLEEEEKETEMEEEEQQQQEEENKEEIQETKTLPSSMQILTDAATLATGPESRYPPARLPSPPLSPRSTSVPRVEKEMGTPTGMLSPKSDTEECGSPFKELPTTTTFMGNFAMLTPRAESSPFNRVSYESESRRNLEAAIALAQESNQEEEKEEEEVEEEEVEGQKENETFDVLDDSSSLKSSQYSSSSSLSSLGSSAVESKQSRSKNEEERKGVQLPEKNSNLLWSFCKTTVVVSAAVVVLSLGLGRKRD